MLGCLTKTRTTTLRKLPLFQQTQIRLATNARAPNENELTEALLRIQKKVAKEKIPWFLSQMPPAYFRAIGPEEQLQHINAITALSYAEQPSVLLHSPDHKVYSFIRSVKNYPGLLATTIRSLPQEVDGASLARVKIFTTLDDTYSMDIFRFGKQEAFTGKNTEEQEAETTILKLCKDIQDGKYKNFKDYPQPAPYFESDEVKKFLRCCNSMYVKFSNERRIASQIALYKRVQGTEGVAIEIEHGWETRQHKLAGGNAPQAMITIAAANVLPKTFLQKAATYCGLKGLKILRAHMDTVKDEGNGHVAMTRILVSSSDMSQYKDLNWSEIDTQMRYLKWCDDRILRFWSRHPEIGLDAAEIIIAYGHMLHGVLSRIDSHAYSLPLIFELLEHHQSLPLSKKIANLFLNRFNPSPNNELSNNETFQKEVDKIRGEIRRYVENEENILVLNKFLDAVCGTLRTNKYLRTRYALALRLDPNILGYGSVGKETPFGAFFVNGRRFKAFHVRFRDIARGGLRVVAPLTEEAHWLESSRQYTEAYNLAFAQQLKNKDIPEGGSKAVLLVQPNERMMYPKHRDFIMRKSVKAFTDALLDLNTTDPNVKTNISDYYGKDELIYLGPDENIIPQDIVWMTKRAAYRKYPIPRAFISSKPDSGINHKVYGVTSEGVAVFCDVALRTMGIDPKKQQFTVKITGGTDGDVAGNMLKILFREYGENARVVGICDHTAVLEDPDGLSSQELLRLFNESLPLEFYNEKCIGAEGVFAKIMEDVDGQRKTNAEAIRLRNSMHNRVKSDLFVPAGGRPNTINDNNWKSYLDENNKPSSPLIVEGANLFITPEARQMLFEHGKVIIAKDSSANKCGVMCSSYEIISNMLLEKEEFMQIKEELIQDVLKKLKQLAKVEAELLFREYKKNPNIALPKYSERVSRAIIRLHDAIVENFDELQKQDKNALQSLIQEHLPHKLAEIALNRVEKDVPEPYIKSIIAATLASKIVYREGLQFTESQPDNMLSSLAMKYLKQEKKVLRLVKSVKASGHPDADVIADLLMRGGVRAGIESL